MTKRNGLTLPPVHSGGLIKMMLSGLGIALVLIGLFIFKVNNPDPSWGSNWRMRPLIITPLAGAAGGAFFYLMSRFGHEGGWKKVMMLLVGLIGFLFALWIGTILGLDGTLWD